MNLKNLLTAGGRLWFRMDEDGPEQLAEVAPAVQAARLRRQAYELGRDDRSRREVERLRRCRERMTGGLGTEK